MDLQDIAFSSRFQATQSRLPADDGPSLDELAITDTDLADDVSGDESSECVCAAPIALVMDRLRNRASIKSSLHPLLAQRSRCLPLLC